MSTLPVSACFIARDEEGAIGDAVRSVDFAAEVVLVVDRRSRDRTAAAAREAKGAEQRVVVVESEWRGHVAQKDLAVAEAGEEWVLCLDADERVSPELRAELIDLFERRARRHDAYSVPRRTRYLGRWIRHGGWYPDRKVRLFRRGRARWGGTDPHDRVIVAGSVGRLRGDLLHLSYESVHDHLQKMKVYATLAARELHERGTRFAVLRMLVHPPAKFIKAYLLRLGFLDRFPGLAVALLGAFSVFLKYARLWELGENDRLARKSGAVPLETAPEERR